MAISSLMASLGLNVSPFKAGLTAAKGDARSAGADISSALGSAVNSQLAKFASIGFAEEVIRRTINYADQVQELASRLGISTDALQQWDYALGQTGGSIDDVT